MSSRLELELKVDALENTSVQKGQDNGYQRKMLEARTIKLEEQISAKLESENSLIAEVHRLRDYISHDEERIETLESDVRTQTKLINLLKEEQSHYLEECRMLESTNNNLRCDNENLQKYILSLRSELEMMKNKNEELQHEVAIKTQQQENQKRYWEGMKIDLETQINSFSNIEIKYQTETKRLSQNCSELTERNNELIMELSKIKKDFQSLQRSESSIKAELQSVTEEQLIPLRSELNRLQLQLRNERESSIRNITELESQLNNIQNVRMNSQRDLLSHRSSLETMKRQLEDCQLELTRKTQQYDQQRKQWETTKNSLESQIEVRMDTEKRIREELRKLDLKVSEFTKRKDELESEVYNLSKSLLKQKEELAASIQAALVFENRMNNLYEEKVLLTTNYSNMTSEMSILRNKVETLERELAQRQAEFAKIQNKYNENIHTQELKISSLIQSENSAKMELRRMEQKFVEANQKYNELRIEIEKHLSITRKSEDEAHASQQTATEILQQLQLEQQETNRYRSLIEALKSELVKVKDVNNELQFNTHSLNNKLSLSQVEVSSLRSELELARNRVEALEKEFSERSHSLESTRRRSDSTRLALEAQINTLTESEVRLRSEVRQGEHVREELTQRLKNQEQELIEVREELANRKRIEADMNDDQRRIAEQQILVLQTELRRLQNQLKEEQSRSTQMTRELESRILTLQTEKLSTQRELLSIRAELEAAKQRANMLEVSVSKRDQQHIVDQMILDKSKTTMEMQVATVYDSDARLRQDLLQTRLLNSELQERIRKYESELVSLKADSSIARVASERALGEMRKRIFDEKYGLLEKPSLAENSIHTNSSSRGNSPNSNEIKVKYNENIRILESENKTLHETISNITHELEQSKNRLNVMEKDYTQKLQQYDQLRVQWMESRSALESQLNSANKSYNELRAELQLLEEQNTRLSDKVVASEKDVARLTQEVQLLREGTKGRNGTSPQSNVLYDGDGVYVSSTLQLRRLQHELAEERSKSSSLTSQLQKCQREMQQLDAMKTYSDKLIQVEPLSTTNDQDISIKSLQSKITALNEEGVLLRRQLSEAIDRADKASHAESQLRIQLKAAQSSVHEESLASHRAKWDDQRQQLQKEVQRQLALVMTLKEELSASQQLQQEYQQHLEHAKKEAENKISSYTMDLEMLRKKVQGLETEKASLTLLIADLQNQIEKLKKAVKGPDTSPLLRRIEQMEIENRQLSMSLSSSHARHTEDLSVARKTENVLRESLQRLEQQNSELESELALLKANRINRNDISNYHYYDPNNNNNNNMLQLGYVDESTIFSKSNRKLNSELIDDSDLGGGGKAAMYSDESALIESLKEELLAAQRRADLLTEQKLAMSSEYEEQIHRLEQELNTAKSLDSEVIAKLRSSWDLQRSHLERELSRNIAQVKVLEKEQRMLHNHRKDEEAKLLALQAEVQSLRTQLALVSSSSRESLSQPSITSQSDKIRK